MKKIIIVLLLICPMCWTVLAHEKLAANNDFASANDLYTAEQYSDAIRAYNSILENHGESPELYYNLANAYYKSEEVGHSILNYERALRLKPFYADAKYNLSIAQTKVIDRVEDKKHFFISEWITKLMFLLHTNTWTMLSVFMFIAFLILFFIFAFSPKIFWRKFGFRAGLTALCISIIFVSFAGITHKHFLERAEAIVMTGVTTVKSSPDDSGTDLFVLHEGIKVEITETLSEWCEIKLGNGNMGWIKAKEIERI